MNFSIECEEETDGRWIAEIPQLPGILSYGKTPDDAMAERLEHGESRPVDFDRSRWSQNATTFPKLHFD